MEKAKLILSERNKYTYLYKWNVEKPKTVLHIIHGSREHIGRYNKLANFLNQNQIAVYGMDLEGHGQSALEQKKEGHMTSFKEVIKNIDKVNSIIQEDYPRTKIILYGHSMGSFIVRYYLSLNKNIDAIISGTLEQSKLLTQVGLLVTKIEKFFRGKQKNNIIANFLSYKDYARKSKGSSWLSNINKVQEEYDKDPLNFKVFTNESFITMLSWIKLMSRKESYTNYLGKLLIIAGSLDVVGQKGKGPKTVFNKFKKYSPNNKNIKLKLYKKSKHEIHNDIEEKEVCQDILKFINN